MASRSRRAVAPSLCALLVLSSLVACGSSSNDTNADAAGETSDDAFGQPDTTIEITPEPDTGPKIHCHLDNLTDPVAFCVQKTVFLEWHDVMKGVGVIQSWDSTSFVPDKDSSGTPLHDNRDDVLFAAAAGRYLQSGKIYGDNEIEAQVLGDLNAVLPKIEAEYATPDASDPELYFELRDVATTLRQIFDADNAQKIDAIADAMGNAILDGWHDLGPFLPPPPGDAGDAGPDAATDAASDASKPDVASDVPDVPFEDGILGTPASGGGFDYVTSNAAYGAAALIDMTARHPTDGKSSSWQLAAMSTFNHVLRRARDASGTRLLFTELVTTPESTAPEHDTLAGAAPMDDLRTDVQAVVALSLSRAKEIVDAHSGSFAPSVQSFTFAVTASDLLNTTEGVPLWDADKTGYFEGWSLSTSSAIPRKPTRANALMLAAIHRVYVQFGTLASAHIKPLKIVLVQTTPENTSLLSALLGQGSWFVATSPSFDLTGLTDPRAKSFFSSADAIACAGLWEQWFGAPK